jgi:hypothetical protein
MKKIIRKCCWLYIVTWALFVAVPLTAAQADIINFDYLPPFANYAHVPDGYGSTADVTVSYRTLNHDLTQAFSYAESWNAGYADLKTAVYAAASGYILDVTITAKDPSKSVVLNSFDVAAYPPGNYTREADVFEVRDGIGTVLVDYKSFDISGLIAQTLYPGVSANSISILLGYDWNNGINNINYSIGTAPVPIPSAILLFGTGLAGLAGTRLRRKIS